MKKSAKRRSCIGSGLIALDIVIRGKPRDPVARAFSDTGGSCGNVLCILGYLGWQALPHARLGTDVASSQIAEELRSYGADLRYTSFHEGDDAPIIIQYLKDDGKGGHRFDVHHPLTGDMLPRYKAVTIAGAAPLLEGKDTCDVFYCDRITPANIRLAQALHERGSLVFLEPQRPSTEDLSRILPYVDVLKVSEGRIADFSLLPMDTKSGLTVIETLGERGMRFQCATRNVSTKAWTVIPGLSGLVPVDTAGAGDWTSAYLIHVGYQALRKRTADVIEEVLSYSRYWSSLAIMFEGARGLMHHLSTDMMMQVTGDELKWSKAIQALGAERPTCSAKVPSPVKDLLRRLGLD